MGEISICIFSCFLKTQRFFCFAENLRWRCFWHIKKRQPLSRNVIHS
ncbi:hypothetical protein SB48_HM08orf01630 [Heyndrickxia coagulans]|uniref:Uncharacterized protein n=1 Tax=Heyndrickxia coagulans TaxID=1398 RepID=A0AAN0T4X1_HEYCO|nr:hypothetical protein SB48_HM08orf01630 [Heyndrickxia coagulans]